MSLHIHKLFKNPLALAGGALFIHIGSAIAADATGDTQQQVRDFLTGANTAHSSARSVSSEGAVASPTADGQELIRQVLLGTAGSRVTGAQVVDHAEIANIEAARQRPVLYSDTQAAVRQFLIGQPGTSAGS
jgi:hypothetical protein